MAAQTLVRLAAPERAAGAAGEARPARAAPHRISAALVVAGAAIGLVANPLHPHAAESDVEATARAIAQSGMWVGIHLAIIVAVLLLVGGLVGLAHLLEDGPAAPVARLGSAAALL